MLIPITIAFILCGILVIEVPLIGLGSDQVTKSLFVENIEAYYNDEHRHLLLVIQKLLP